MLLILILSIHIWPVISQTRTFRPSRPVLSPRLCFTRQPSNGRIIRYISDQQTKCQYWECTAGRPVLKRCGLQTFISEFYEGDDYNPCTETNTDLSLQFDCTRKGFDPEGNPTCIAIYEQQGTCKNGGRVLSQGNLCWCDCLPGFSGYECTIVLQSELREPQVGSEELIEEAEVMPTVATLSQMFWLMAQQQSNQDPPPAAVTNAATVGLVEFAEDDVTTENSIEENDVTNEMTAAPTLPPRIPNRRPVASVDENGRFISGDPCPTGPPRDYCAEQNGCLNGGRCENQCLGAVCHCVDPYVAGRRCEAFRCSVNVECMNGGTCSRGRSGIDTVATCSCLPGFGGPMCENRLRNV
ncbi:fibropellin-3-like [Watersipora subatra]|uniref:fibropellin-3-like n=1 Tax=Watersipora subatra TaxID=2589382 RepID=UPI00355BB3EB